VPTLRFAAALLAAARDAESLAPIAALLGCGGSPAPLDGDSRAALGIPEDCPTALVARGPGTLRALLLETSGPRPVRDVLLALASRMSARAPHLLWIACACDRNGREVALAAWTPRRGAARVAALIVERDAIVDSDAETLCALAAAMEPVDVLTHAKWVAILGREAVTRRFYRTLERLVGQLAEGAGGRVPEASRREIALLYASRLLFLSFLEAKEWLDGDRAFLSRRFDDCMAGRGGFQRRVLLPLFFGTLNTPARSRAAAARALGRIPFLNGGLFARAPVERLHGGVSFDDENLGRFFSELLTRYRFTAREESSDWTEAAVDPEMLGRAFESLMAGRERRETGAFFTPHELVARVTDDAMSGVLGTPLADLLPNHGRDRPPDLAPGNGFAVPSVEAARERLGALRFLDPACGSGAFLVHALERVADLMRALGDPRPVTVLRRAVLTTSIFGVDVNPTAVWLCQLRLWLSVVIDSPTRDPDRVAALPNLDRHIRVGDALAGHDVADVELPAPRGVARLRQRYARSVGVRKRTLARALDRAERLQAIACLDKRIECINERRRDILVAARGRNLFGERGALSTSTRDALAELRAELGAARARRRALASGAALPFAFATHFADVMNPGFDVVIGNPPWVRVHRIPPAARATLRRDYVSYRGAAWREGAAGARASAGFAGQVDLAALFIERSLGVVRPGGVVALLVPSKLWRSLAGGGVRRLLASEHVLLRIEDWSDAPSLFDAAVYPSLVVAMRGPPPAPARAPELHVTVHAARVAATWQMQSIELGLDQSPGAPWLLLPPLARRAFDAVRAAGTPLAVTAFGAPLLGVKSGCNGAFIVRLTDRGPVSDNGTIADVEEELLRPLVRGERVGTWRIDPRDERVIWTHGTDGRPLHRLPPRAERWFRPWRRRLVARADARGAGRWWTLFRIESAACDVPRVVWADFGRAPRAAVLGAGDAAVPLNTCYVARCPAMSDAYALAAVLNSPLAAVWLAAIAEPARGRFRRYLGWTMSLLPIPSDWPAARSLLAPVGERAVAGEPPGDAELLDVVTRAFGLRPRTIRPLLDWSIR
jgi:hypothetical protein